MRRLGEAIMAGQLALGDRLPPERQLAGSLGVSRGSLREGLRALESIGVLEARRGQGSSSGSVLVARRDRLASLLALHTAIRRVPLADLVEVRVALEAMAARGAAQRCRDPGELEGLVAAMRSAGSDLEFMELDNEFHQTVARLSGNVLLPLLMEALREAMVRQMLAAFATLEDPASERKRLLDEHARVTELIVRGDSEAASAALVQHIRCFYSRLLEGAAAVPGS